MRRIYFVWTFVALGISALAQTEVGLVGGVARDSSSGHPLAEAQIVARNLDSGLAQSTVSRTDGVFALTHLEPGRYEVLATKQGYLKSTTRVEVGAHQIARVELALDAATLHQGVEAPADATPLTPRERQLLERIERLERRMAALAPPPPPTGIEPAPVNNKPEAAAPATQACLLYTSDAADE